MRMLDSTVQLEILVDFQSSYPVIYCMIYDFNGKFYYI